MTDRQVVHDGQTSRRGRADESQEGQSTLVVWHVD